jgi:rod shape-determining protein MreB
MRNWGWKEKLERFWKSSVQGLNLASAEELAVYLGAANTRIYLAGQGVVVYEPSVIALNNESNEVIAVGQESKRLARRQPPEIRIAHPLKD